MAVSRFDDLIPEQDANRFSDLAPEGKVNRFGDLVGREPESTETPTEQIIRSTLMAVPAAAETVTTAITGMVAMPIAGWAGLATAAIDSVVDADLDEAGVIEAVQDALTWQPKSQTAKDYLSVIAYPFQWLHGVADKAGEKVLEKTDSPMAAAATSTAIDFLPWVVGPKLVSGAKGALKFAGKPKLSKPSRISVLSDDMTAVVADLAAPISQGSPAARVAAKTYANALRGIDSVRNFTVRKLGNAFSKEQLNVMGRALKAEEMINARQAKPGAGLSSLPLEQRAAVEALVNRHAPIVQEAINLHILPEGSRTLYFPHKVTEALGGAASSRIFGKKLIAATKHAKKRKYQTLEETAAAASLKLGKKMKPVEDVRSLALVTAELEKAIAGKKLVNEIKAHGKSFGVETTMRGPTDGYFTLDSPALREWVPRVVKRDTPGPQGGMWKSVKDMDGNPIFDQRPIYIHESFKGPLKAVLGNEPSSVVSALMQLKAKSMHVIMFSPIMHNAVIWGKALPFQPLRTLTMKNYFDGHKLMRNNTYVKRMTGHKNTEAFMRAAADDGVAPIGQMGWMQRMTDVMEAPRLEAGRSWTAQSLGFAAKPLGKRAQHGVMRTVDKAGELWHDKFLWDQINAAQYGMYANLKNSFMKKGMGKEAAGQVAGHLANRFAGSIPFEDMGHGIRSALNIALFSRTFNLTNIGIYKDALRGTPRAVRDIILKSGSKIDADLASSTLRRAASATLAKDILAMYVLNSMIEDTFRYMKTGDAGEIAKQYAENFDSYVEGVKENPLAAVFDIEQLSSLAWHEPGKEYRIYAGQNPDGSGYYVRNPVGKIGEDLLKAAGSPLEMFADKLSPTARFATGLFFNDKSLRKKYGTNVYSEEGSWRKVPENLGSIAYWFIESHMPSDYIEALIDVATDNDPFGNQQRKLALQWFGLSTSKGAPGSPAAGFIYKAMRQHEEDIKKAMPGVRKKIQGGKYDEAADLMVQSGFTVQK